MNIIIAGAGEIGRHMAIHLSNERHNIAVIEMDARIAADLDSQIDARVIPGNASSVNTLVEAGVGECELFFALTSDNDTNLVCSSLAKALGAAKVICRVHPELQREEWLFDHRGHFDIDHVFSSERLAAVELSKFIRNPDSLVVEEIARGRIELQQIHVSAKADANGKTLRQINFPQRVRVASITRGQEVLVPSADEVIRAGDLVTVFGEPNKLRDAVGRLGKGARDERELNVVIFGGGEYGFSLAQMLESWNCRVRIFDQDPVRCSYLSQRLPNAAVLNADATRLAELREEQVGDADFFVATAGSDEDNVMTCLQAHSLGAKHCLTLIHRADYADAISGSGEHFGIMAAVSPREATRQDLMRFVTSDRYHVVKNLGAGEIIESSVPPGSAMVGRPIRDIGLPPGCVLLAIVHGIHANVPAAEDEIHVGDNVYALVNDKARKKFLKLMGR